MSDPRPPCSLTLAVDRVGPGKAEAAARAAGQELVMGGVLGPLDGVGEGVGMLVREPPQPGEVEAKASRLATTRERIAITDPERP